MVELSFPSQIILLHRQRAHEDVGHSVTDRHHGQLRLYGVDHVGHGVGEVLESGAVHLVADDTDTEHLQDNFAVQIIWLAETFSNEENMKMGLNVTFFIVVTMMNYI